MPIIVHSRRGDALPTVAAWGALAPPASAKHWKEGRSAMELARAWTSVSGPAALQHLLNMHPATAHPQFVQAVAEAQVAFDDQPGGRRNHDLLVKGVCAGGPTVVGVEAKADETYGQTVNAYHKAAHAKAAHAKAAGGKPTNAPQRLTGLLADLADTSLDRSPELGALRYQLLSGLAGTLAAAKPGEQAVFVVHEFVTGETRKAKRKRNHDALALALKELFGLSVPAHTPWLLGPLHVPARRWAHIDLWVGQIVTKTETATPAS